MAADADAFDFRAAYLTADRRVLGAFRIVFGCVLWFDLLRRGSDLTLFYSNAGIVENHVAIFAPPSHPYFSLFLAFSTPAEVAVAFALTGAVYLAYLVGYRTRLAQIAAFVCLTSLNARNTYFEDGGCMAMNLAALWTLFLPIGDRFSIDAIVRSMAEPIAGPRRSLERARAPFVSIAVLAVIVEIAAIYAMNVIHKSGPTWHQGSAVHDVLWQGRFATPLAMWLRQHEPAFFSPAASFGTLVLEAAIPLLVLSPKARTETRTIVVVAATAFHLGIALLMTLGPFSYAMIAFDLLVLPSEAADYLGEKRRPRAAPVTIRFDRAHPFAVGLASLLRALDVHERATFVPADSASGLEIEGALGWPLDAIVRSGLIQRALTRRTREHARFELPIAAGFRSVFYAREIAAALVLALLLSDLGAENPWLKKRLGYTPPEWARAAIAYPRLYQSWNMFSPDAPVDDGITVIDGVTADGRHFDPFTGAAPDLDAFVWGKRPYSAMLCDYLGEVHEETDRRALNRFLRAWRSPSGDALVSYEAWWVSYQAPDHGAAPAPVDIAHTRFLAEKL